MHSCSKGLVLCMPVAIQRAVCCFCDVSPHTTTQHWQRPPQQLGAAGVVHLASCILGSVERKTHNFLTPRATDWATPVGPRVQRGLGAQAL